MTSMSIPALLFKTFPCLCAPHEPAVKEAVILIQKIVKLGGRFFSTLQGCWYVGYGSKLFLWDGLRGRIKLYREKKRETMGSIPQPLQRFYARLKFIQHQTTCFSFLGGLSAVGAGGCGIASGICRLSYQGLSGAVTLLTAAGRGFFMFGDLLSLQYYVDLFFEASELAKSSRGDARQVAFRMRVSAGMGIFICFSYLFAGALVLLGGSAGMAFAIGCVASMTSCLKGLFDFFYRNDQTYLYHSAMNGC
ncbi:type III secretionT3S chaperone [Parachlamydia sp. AcF125]|uniref:type III secretionT3S chaperone n=1 Tax=Parachlamydia sp. AcF125 TaxID=2795736 RepID=UPI001BCA200D|nr:type III secretionT3S chaperone [Parachlamydia sp. AcF125]MBS4167457.1 hypothetical protein [Parachlamydia sp. AcF125]